MKNTPLKGVMVMLTMTLLFSVCIKAGAQTGGGKSITSADELKAYLNSQPANSADKLIKVKMSVNEQMIGNVVSAINSAGKYVSLDLSGSPLTTIPSYAFQECKNLVDITIPDSVTSIGEWAFSDCESLISITIPNGVTSIEEGAFSGCESLTTITIPNSVTSIGWAFVFQSCHSLLAINVDAGNNAYMSENGILYNKKKTDLIQYPLAKKDTTFTIPNGVISIEWGAFSGCKSLTSITIPTSVTKIGQNAFTRCTNLTNVTFQGKIPSSKLDGEVYGTRKGSIGDLFNKYLRGGIGTYTRPNGESTIWTKQ